MDTFAEFRDIIKKSLSENPDANVKKMILQKFVRRIEVGTDSVKIYWSVDKEFYLNEVSQAQACGSFSSKNVGSKSLTIGASGRTRTGTPFDRRF